MQKRVLAGLLALAILGSLILALYPRWKSGGLDSADAVPGNADHRSIEGVLYSQDGKILIRCPREKTGKLVIPDGVTSIGDRAFAGCTGLTSVTIPSSLTEIDWTGFSFSCEKLIAAIGHHFEGCGGLTSIEAAPGHANYCSIDGILYSKDGKILIRCPEGKTGKLAIPDGVTNIGDKAFAGCTGLSGELIIPNSVTEIGDDAFANCTGFTGNLAIPDSVTEVGWYGFGGCTGFTSLTIGDGLAGFLNWAFSLPNAVSIEVSPGNKIFSSANGLLLSKDGTELIQCPDGKTSMTIPASVTTTIWRYTLDASSLTSIDVAPGNANYCSTDGILYSRDGKVLIRCPIEKAGKLAIPDGVTEISDYAFYCCRGLTGVTIPASVKKISDWAFDGCDGLTSIEVAPGNANYHSTGGTLYSRDGKELLRCSKEKTGN